MKDLAVVMGLNKLAPVDRRATGRQDRRRLDRFSQMGQNFRIGPGSVMKAINWMSPSHPVRRASLRAVNGVMNVFSFHLAACGIATTLRAVALPPTSRTVPSLVHAECLVPMTLGQPVALPSRYRPHQIAVFAAWQGEAAIEEFFHSCSLGHALAAGWHVRMEFVRRWGSVRALDGLPLVAREHGDDQPVVAVTLARLRISQAFRFVRWGKPVEEQVRDNPATTIALAATRPIGTLSTFSILRTQRAMTDMVHGRSSAPSAKRHARAMVERNRKDFHHEFTTLRFRPMSEHGTWEGRDRLLPTMNNEP